MKSLYVKIGLATTTVLVLAVLIFIAINQSMIKDYFNPVFDDMDEVSVQEAAEMVQTSGPQAVTAYMHRLDSVFGGKHFLLDSSGRDVVTGRDLSRYLPQSGLAKYRGVKGRENMIAHRSSDGKYWFLVTSPFTPKNAPLYRYYFLVAGAGIAMGWLGAVYIVSPIRKVAAGIRKFGKGDLSVRLPETRSDEIGSLIKTFNSMAERIQISFQSEQRLLADVSHELRSPLARLHFSVKLARTAEDRDVALDRVKRDVDRLTTLVSSLVEMARAEGSASRGAQEAVKVRDIVKDTIEDCAIEIEARGGQINLSDSPEIVVNGNSELLRRAVENVIRNAIRHSPQESAIDVEQSVRDGMARIAIRDYGPGVPNEFLERIFDSFFRTDEARDTDTGGVGLGLAIAKRAVQIHGGMIRAENANPGLRVEMLVPLAESASKASPTASA